MIFLPFSGSRNYFSSDRIKTSEPLASVVAEGSGDKAVIQYSKDCTIKDFPELDFFGYLKTQKESNGLKRAAKVRVSNAISMETFKGDIDFLTNKGLADRIDSNMNIAQSEIANIPSNTLPQSS